MERRGFSDSEAAPPPLAASYWEAVMHKARAFFYVCAGLFLLALSYHIGATNAGAQAPGSPVVGVAGTGIVTAMTSGGDAYVSTDYGRTWSLYGNCFAGTPTPALQETWGHLKVKYRN